MLNFSNGEKMLQLFDFIKYISNAVSFQKEEEKIYTLLTLQTILTTACNWNWFHIQDVFGWDGSSHLLMNLIAWRRITFLQQNMTIP